MQHLLKRLLLIIIAIPILAVSIAACGDTSSTTSQTTITPTIVAPTAKTTVKPTIKLTPKPTQGVTSVVITHGQPHLGGNISDFYGKYGTPLNGVRTNGDGSQAASWLTDPNNADGGSLLLVHFSATTGQVNYIAYNGLSTWSKAQYQDFFISTFAPPGTVIDTATNQWWASQGGDPYNPIAYNSSIGKFFLHISDGSGYMNTVN